MNLILDIKCCFAIEMKMENTIMMKAMCFFFQIRTKIFITSMWKQCSNRKAFADLREGS